MDRLQELVKKYKNEPSTYSPEEMRSDLLLATSDDVDTNNLMDRRLSAGQMRYLLGNGPGNPNTPLVMDCNLLLQPFCTLSYLF